MEIEGLGQRVIACDIISKRTFQRQCWLGIAAIIAAMISLSADAAISYVQGNTNGVNPGASISTTYTSAQTAGNINIVVLSWFSLSAHTVTMTDTTGNTYSLAISTKVQPPNYWGGTTSVYYAKNIAAAAAGTNAVTITLDGSESYVELSVTEYSGIDQVNPLDVAIGASGVDAVANSGYATTTNANDLLFGNAYVAQWADTAGSGYAKRFNTYWGDAVEDQTVTSAGSYYATLMQSADDWWVMQMVAFKAASTSIQSNGPITYTYSYDKLGRITQASGSDGSIITYTYDANGNVTTLNRQ